jgi:hypothetical protein
MSPVRQARYNPASAVARWDSGRRRIDETSHGVKIAITVAPKAHRE